MTEFRLLGQVQMWVDDHTVELGPPKQRAVLAALLVDAGRPVAVEVIVDRVWGEDPPAQVRAALYSHIMRIRRALTQAAQAGGARMTLIRGPAGYTMDVDRDRVDAHRFRRLVGRAHDLPEDDPRRLALLRDAVALWQGPPLAGIRGEWAERTRCSWQQQYIDAAVAYAQAELRAGNAALVCGPLRELAHEYPLVEPLVAVLVQALGAAGRTPEALECYAAFRRRLVDELGTDPGPQLQALHQAVLRGECAPPPSPRPPRPPAPAMASRPTADHGETPIPKTPPTRRRQAASRRTIRDVCRWDGTWSS
jgi:DNA-binding SARP family transcriptional activator